MPGLVIAFGIGLSPADTAACLCCLSHIRAASNRLGSVSGKSASPSDKAFGVLNALGGMGFACESVARLLHSRCACQIHAWKKPLFA